jgi:hypothetical protein
MGEEKRHLEVQALGGLGHCLSGSPSPSHTELFVSPDYPPQPQVWAGANLELEHIPKVLQLADYCRYLLALACNPQERTF